jgi:hypothetical protein
MLEVVIPGSGVVSKYYDELDAKRNTEKFRFLREPGFARSGPE